MFSAAFLSLVNASAQSSLLMSGVSHTQQGANPTPCTVALGFNGSVMSSITIQGWGVYIPRPSFFTGSTDLSHQYRSIGETYASPAFILKETQINANVGHVEVFRVGKQESVGFAEIMHAGSKIVSVKTDIYNEVLVCTSLDRR